MRILAFESSAKAASVALLTDGTLTAEAYQNCGLTHSVTLLTMARDLLRQTGLDHDAVDWYAVAHGPGSFTGVRIGISTVKGLSWATQRPCIGVSTLEAMASMHLSQEGVLCPVMDARRGQAYNALFRVENGVLRRLTPDRAIALDELASELETLGGRILLMGDGAPLCYRAFGDRVPQRQLASEPLLQQRAAGVALAAWRAAQSGQTVSAAALTPCYLRLSQAERERLARLTKEQT